MSFKMGKTWGAGLLLSIALLSSCKSLKNTNTLFLSEYDKFADTAKSVYVANGKSQTNTNYLIQPFDLIAIRNVQNNEGLVSTSTEGGVQTSAAFRTDQNGVVTLPVVGQVVIQGLTQAEAGKKIQDLYAKSLLKNPIIELTVVNYKVTILGEIAKPGNYVLERERIDLVELVGKSGGFLLTSDPRKIKIIRGDRKNPEIIYVNLQNLVSLSHEKLVLQNNDIIYVSPKRLANVSEGLRGYLAIIQPALLVVNALILITTINKL